MVSQAISGKSRGFQSQLTAGRTVATLLCTIQTGIRIEGTRLFRIVLNVTMEIGTTWPNSVVLDTQWGTCTTLSDDAAGE